MKRSSILALCLVMVVGGGLALARDALGANPKHGGTLTVVHSVDISNFDVQAAPGYEVVWINMNIHNSLLTLDKDLQPVPDLAKRGEVEFRAYDGPPDQSVYPCLLQGCAGGGSGRSPHGALRSARAQLHVPAGRLRLSSGVPHDVPDGVRNDVRAGTPIASSGYRPLQAPGMGPQ